MSFLVTKVAYYSGIEGTISHVIGDLMGFIFQYFAVSIFVYNFSVGFKSFILFACTFILGLVCSTAIFSSCFYLFKINLEYSKIIAIGATFFLNYYVRNKMFSKSKVENGSLNETKLFSKSVKIQVPTNYLR